jgi:hypothetical protein
MHNGKQLRNGQTLLGSGVMNNDTLHLMFHLKGGFNYSIKVTTLSGKVMELNVNETTTIREVKKMLVSDYKIGDEFVLAYAGNVLSDDDKTMQELGFSFLFFSFFFLMQCVF